MRKRLYKEKREYVRFFFFTIIQHDYIQYLTRQIELHFKALSL